MTEDKYRELREAAQKATPGPWHRVFESQVAAGDIVEKEKNTVALKPGGVFLFEIEPNAYYGNNKISETGCGRQAKRDADFIAKANPKAVLSLLDDIERAKAEVLDELEALVTKRRSLDPHGYRWSKCLAELRARLVKPKTEAVAHEVECYQAGWIARQERVAAEASALIAHIREHLHALPYEKGTGGKTDAAVILLFADVGRLAELLGVTP